MLATPYYDKLIEFLLGKRWTVKERFYAGSETFDPTAQYLTILRDPNTKRIMFDSRQATIFDALDESPPLNIVQRLHMPFDTFYLELTEKILIGEQEPGCTDYARALLARLENDSSLIHPRGDDEIPGSFINVTLFLSQETKRSYVFTDRSWTINLSTGQILTTKASATETPDPSTGLEFVERNQYFNINEEGSEARYRGWWERAITDYSSLFL